MAKDTNDKKGKLAEVAVLETPAPQQQVETPAPQKADDVQALQLKAIVLMMEQMATLQKQVMELQTKKVSSGVNRLGAGPKKGVRTLDTKTNVVYTSKAAAGKAVAAEYGLDPANNFVWYEVIKKDPSRFKDAV